MSLLIFWNTAGSLSISSDTVDIQLKVAKAVGR